MREFGKSAQRATDNGKDALRGPGTERLCPEIDMSTEYARVDSPRAAGGRAGPDRGGSSACEKAGRVVRTFHFFPLLR
jgi:hypothetical protein